MVARRARAAEREGGGGGDALLGYWREAGAADALAAKSVYLAYYRRRWSCEVALAGARLRVARMTCVTGEAPEPAVVGAGDFDPADHAAFAEIAEFVFGGPPRGQ